MVKTAPETILLRGEPNRKERDAGGTIIPGHLLQLDADGDVVVHPTAEGVIGPRWFAVENDIAGDDIDDAYASGEVCQIQSARPGEEINAILAVSQTIGIGDLLISAGNGQVTELVAESGGVLLNSVIGMALDAVTSDSATTPRLRIEVI